MATINYVDEAYFNAYITEILTELKAWIDTDKNIAIKKVLFNNNSLSFYKNPNAVDTDEPQYKIDLPVERFLDQTQTILIPKFTWSEELYPNSINPNLEEKPVFVLAVKGIASADNGTDTITYSFLNMETIIKQYQVSSDTSTINLVLDEDTSTLSGSVNISGDTNNSLSVGTDGGLYSPVVDISGLTTQIENLTTQVNELSTLCQQLSDRITVLENKK